MHHIENRICNDPSDKSTVSPVRSCRGTPICLQTLTTATETSYDSVFPVGAEACTIYCCAVVDLKFKTVVLKKVFIITLLSAVSHLLDSTVIFLKNKKCQNFPHFTFFFLEERRQTSRRNMWPLTCKGTRVAQEFTTRLCTVLPSSNMAAIPHTNMSTHIPHQHVDWNTWQEQGESKNMIQMVSMVRDEQWLEKNKEKHPKNVIFIRELCKDSAFLLISIINELYSSDIYLYKNMRHSAVRGRRTSAAVWKASRR